VNSKTSILRVRGRLETQREATAEVAEQTVGDVEIMAESLLRGVDLLTVVHRLI
jgi:hypothetical protein